MGLTFLAPWVLVAAAAAAAAVVALHLLAVGPPPEAALPTARFVPQRRARAMRRASSPADVALLALRVLALLLAGAALARPTRVNAHRPVARVIVVDQSRAVADAGAAMDSAIAQAGEGDVLIAVDGRARAPVLYSARLADSLRQASRAGAERGARDAGGSPTTAFVPDGGTLSVALAAALRAAPMLRTAADSLLLVVVSPLAHEELDAATPTLRALWGGSARVLRVPAAQADSAAGPRRVQVRSGTTDDALIAAVSLAGMLGGGDARVRIVRDGVSAADLAWARAGGHVLVDWPADGRPGGWSARATVDTVGAVTVGDGAPLVAPLVRRARPAGGAARAVAWWVDGETAADEAAAGAGCVRSVGIEVPQRGDLALDAPFAGLLAALVEPCGGARALGQLSADEPWLRGPASLRPVASVAELAAERSLLPAWLLAAALALLLAEPLARRALRTEIDA